MCAWRINDVDDGNNVLDMVAGFLNKTSEVCS
jgi:hypothetical protein